MGQDVVEGDLHTGVETDIGGHLRNDSLNFAVVENNRDGLIAEERSREVETERVADSTKEVSRYVIGLQLDTEDICDGSVDLIPSEGLVRGDLECFADGVA